MARYTGPVCRLCRRQGEKLMLKGERCASRKCAMERRKLPPGQQRRPRRRKVSDRGLQLKEKQKARQSYGVLERQFRRHFASAEKRPGITGENLLQILEMRLDNVVYRLGFADSRRQARQIVSHGHITLNGRKTDIPSCAVKSGDIIAWGERSTRTEHYKRIAQQIQDKIVPNWLSLDRENLRGQVLTPPSRADIDLRLDEKAIVEYYSR
ncbi:MAG: 30S ribosomal protein S4 [Dehalococcoidia bacterium]|nr:30S ribosomal protein S4 [Dehalococcoidia bacterium]